MVYIKIIMKTVTWHMGHGCGRSLPEAPVLS